METAGKNVDDESLRDALKENGIGRPSTRAAIIETLFRRRYISKQRKSLFPTATGKELIGIIHEDLLKSAELTGQWEKKLREIERGEYAASQFIEELKEMVSQIVQSVIADNSSRKVTPGSETAAPQQKKTKKKAEKKNSSAQHLKEGDTCPMCRKGKLIRGKTSLGCSRWKEGCTFRAPFEQ